MQKKMQMQKKTNNEGKPNPGSQNLNSPKVGDLETYSEIQEEITEIVAMVDDMCYSVDDLIDVWCRGVTNGAVVWQYCIESGKPLPVSFEAGVVELVNEVRNSDNKAVALQQIMGNNMIMLGVFDEKL